jgi:hypothetical protein
MAEFRDGLHLIPEHMHRAVAVWIEEGEPRPRLHGDFLFAILTHDLMAAAVHADAQNARALHAWAMFLYNYVPSQAHGSAEDLDAWYKAHHPVDVTDARTDGEG